MIRIKILNLKLVRFHPFDDLPHSMSVVLVTGSYLVIVFHIMIVTCWVGDRFQVYFGHLHCHVDFCFVGYLFDVCVRNLDRDLFHDRGEVCGFVNFDNLWDINDLCLSVLLRLKNVFVLGNYNGNHGCDRDLHLLCELYCLRNPHNLLLNIIFRHVDGAMDIVSDWHLDRLRYRSLEGDLNSLLLNVVHWLLYSDSPLTKDRGLHLSNHVDILDGKLLLLLNRKLLLAICWDSLQVPSFESIGNNLSAVSGYTYGRRGISGRCCLLCRLHRYHMLLL